MDSKSLENNRSVEIRKLKVIDTTSLLTALMYIHPQFGYSAESIYKKIQSQPRFHLGTYPNTFPNTINEYFWIQSAPNDANASDAKIWKALGTMMLHGTLVYFFYSAALKSNASFLNKQGVMNLWVSARFSDIIHFVIDSDTYQSYYSETELVL